MSNLELKQSLSKHSGRIWNVAWNPKGTILASCGEDKTIRFWINDGSRWINKVILMDGHKRTVRQTAFSPCGNYLASASFDATTCIWDNKSGQFECNATLEGHENEVKSVAWSQSGHYLATCSRDKSVWVWEVTDDDEFDCAAVMNSHTQDVKKVAWHPDRDILASASYDNAIKLFREDPSENDWINFATLIGHESTVWSVSWEKGGKRLASCSDDCTIKIWREYLPGNTEGVPTEDGEAAWRCICTISGYHTRTIYDISWNQKNGLIATASGDDSIRIFKEDDNSDSNQPTFSQVACGEKAHTEDVNCIVWNPVQTDLLATCSDDGDIKLWKFLNNSI